MTGTPKPVTDEPVRGTLFPPWFCSLSGTERINLLSRGIVPPPPEGRLFGFNIGHVGTGAVTGRMLASANFLAMPALDISPLVHGALWGAATAAVAGGWDVELVSVSQQYFRAPRAQPGNLLARARTLNSSSVFVSSAVEVEDPLGRQLGHAIAQWAIRAVDPPPPAAPNPVERTEEPTYPTPDPPDRPPVGAAIPAELFASKTGLEIARMLVSGELPPVPLQHLIGARWLKAGEGEVRVSMPASEWFCRSSKHVTDVALTLHLDLAGAGTILTQLGKNQSAAFLEKSARFLRPVPADGRELTAGARVSQRAGDLFFVEIEVRDADGSVAATASLAAGALDRAERRSVEPERVLATLLFTDIVGSTERAQRMGDGPWRSLLGEHHALVRRELVAHRGREINTVGDGFLARFDSPASALRCARAIRDGVRSLNLEIRAGVHTGECEVQGSDLAGIALHVAARIVAVAGGGEIVVSQMVRDLAAGSGIRFAPRGAHTLKGVEGEYNLFAVED